MSKMKVIFAGTPEFSAKHLQALIDCNDFDIVAAYTQPDRKAGRGKKLTPSPVKEVALAHGIPVEQPLNFKQSETISTLASYQPDIMVVVAYGLILPQLVLDTPKLGCINVHASILPRWRGAAPIQRAIESGDSQSGVTIMQMELGLDTGPMLSKSYLDITPGMSGGELHDKLITLGCPSLIDTLNNIEQQLAAAEVQNDAEATYAHKLSKEDAQIDWQTPAKLTKQKVDAFNPFPVAWFSHNDQAIRVHQAVAIDSSAGNPGEVLNFDKQGLLIATSEGALLISRLQLPGKKAMDVRDLINGSPNAFSRGQHLV